MYYYNFYCSEDFTDCVSSLYFVSTNHNKYLEIQSVLSKYGIIVEFYKVLLVEIQSDSIEEIAIAKSKDAFAEISKPVIVEDDKACLYMS